MKAQIFIDEESEQITATFFGKGRMHDYKLYQLSRVKLGKQMTLRADLGYWGLQMQSLNVIMPQKNSKLHQLSKAEKKANRQLAAKRVKVENVIRRLKIFRILSERYRHRRKRFGLRFNLIAGLHNYELKLKSRISQEVYYLKKTLPTLRSMLLHRAPEC